MKRGEEVKLGTTSLLLVVAGSALSPGCSPLNVVIDLEGFSTSLSKGCTRRVWRVGPGLWKALQLVLQGHLDVAPEVSP